MVVKLLTVVSCCLSDVEAKLPGLSAGVPLFQCLVRRHFLQAAATKTEVHKTFLACADWRLLKLFIPRPRRQMRADDLVVSMVWGIPILWFHGWWCIEHWEFEGVDYLGARIIWWLIDMMIERLRKPITIHMYKYRNNILIIVFFFLVKGPHKTVFFSFKLFPYLEKSHNNVSSIHYYVPEQRSLLPSRDQIN